jgi:Na+/proline symporter/signal transduction histidine kinase
METFNIDTIIFVGFLIVNIVLGLTSSRGIKTIKEYAIGNRNFSTATIAATIVATWIGGGFFCTLIPESYSNGLHFIWVTLLGDILCLSLIALFFAPRMAEFLGKISIASAMGDLYGQRVQIVTAISGFIGISGLIAMQFKIAGMMFEYALGLPSMYGILLAGVIVTSYSALGGIKSVTFTDVIQFLTFAVVMPTLAYFLLQSLDNIRAITYTINNNPIFDYRKVFDFSEPQSLYHLFIFFFFAIPGFSVATFQRVAMAKNTIQVTKSFLIAAIVCFIIGAIICCIGVLVLAINPNLPSQDVIKYLVSDYAVVGLKGIILAGVMAMVMSTVDSYINATAVIIVHDFCKPLKIKFIKNELFSARIVSYLIGFSSIILSLYGSDSGFLQLFILANSFYMPIVSVPFLMALLGFRSTEKSVLLGMATGLLIVLLWKVLDIKAVNSIVVGMIANLIVLMSSHYLLKQPGGWIGIKDNSELIRIRKKRKRKLQQFWSDVKSLNIIDICKNNYPRGEGLISVVGFFVMISVFSSTHTLAKEYQSHYAKLLDVLYPITLFSSALLVSYPLWLQQWKEKKLVGILWNFVALAVLVCFSFLIVLISEFSEIQLMVFMVNIMVISSLSKWKISLFNILFGVTIVTFCYEYYQPLVIAEFSFFSSQFKIIYLLLLVSSSLILFLKPKQDYQELTEQRSDHLIGKVYDIDGELKKSVEVKNEFLRNLEHEAHTPIVGITTMGQVLFENYDKLTEEQRRKGLKEISKSSERLSTLVNNMIDVSKLSSLNYVLNKTLINLSDLIYQRLDHCKKLYLENKDLEFICDIEDDLLVNCDKHYITSTLDNLIVNAITYSKDGRITIEFKKNNDLVKFKITDEGIGIPQKELYAIFGTFTVSSKTKTPAGGRGLGLALCKGTIEAHKGQIWCKSNGKKGSTFTFTLPIEESIKLIEARLTKSELQKQK